MVLCSELLSNNRPQQLYQKHCHPHKYMETMKSSQHKECRTIDARVESQAKEFIRFVVFHELQVKEEHTQRYGDAEPAIKFGIFISQYFVRN